MGEQKSDNLRGGIGHESIDFSRETCHNIRKLGITSKSYIKKRSIRCPLHAIFLDYVHLNQHQ